MAIRTMLGNPFEVIDNDKKTADELWDLISAHANTNDIMAAGSRGGSDKHKTKEGLVMGHAYTLLATVKLSTGDRLIKLRNPWGVDSFHGDWSDESTKWTPALRKEAGAVVNKKDGIIFMDIADFNRLYDQTYLNYDPNSLHRDYFLMLNDDYKNCTKNSVGGCTHTLEVTSRVDQEIMVMANTWDRRASSSQCHTTYNDEWHGVHAEWDTYNRLFNYGSKMTTNYKIKAGETKWIKMDMNFGPHDARDWSVVTFGKEAPVSISHKGGIRSNTMPELEDPDAGKPPSTHPHTPKAPKPKGPTA